ncbi:RDD family protein [Octadecabacter sp. R77987]|uniref:RDD family protein n=1 Tax=Octadecabacter sp. R77987 TaxID=3093874 RepID=UPI00366CEE66
MTAAMAPTTALPDPQRYPEFYASVNRKRLVAWIADVTLVVILALIATPFTAFTAVFYFPFLMFVIGFLYRWSTLASGSATWGMRLMAIELREDDGLRLSGQTAMLHTLGYYVSMAMAPLQLVSIILMAVNPRKQGLSDAVLGTAMLNRMA